MAVISTFIVFVSIMIVALIKRLIPIVIALGVIFIGTSIVYAVFKDTPKGSRRPLRRIGTGCMFLVSGIVLCIHSADGYQKLLSGKMVYGGPSPISIVLIVVGGVFLLDGFIRYLMTRNG